ncbi:MAG TPA: hypothetical protein VED24_03625, partial [Candidatus Acidoferrum sp.]|nr:hypothetical protein [Candidatus Acidoferrum sp.]
RQIVPVLSGYFRQPREDEPLLKMVYEDGTRKIHMLDPKLMLEAGLQRALRYSRGLNSLPRSQLQGRVAPAASKLSGPLPPHQSFAQVMGRA